MIFKTNIYETLYKQKIKVFKMDGKFAFLLLFSKHLEYKAKYKRRRRVSNMILVKMIQGKNVYAHQNLVRSFYLPDARPYWMIKYGQLWFDRL